MSPNICKESVEEAYQSPVEVRDGKVSLWELVQETVKIVVLTDLSSIFSMSSQMITMVFVGHHLGADGMSQYSAGLLVFDVMAMSIVSGLGSAIDTICSQAFGQNPRSPVIGETLQRALIINFMFWIVMSLVFLNSNGIMVYFFGETVGEGGSRFLANCSLYLLSQIISGAINKILFAQRLPGVVACANGAAAVTSPIANYFLTPMGIEGAALSLTCTVTFSALTNVLFCLFHPKVVVREARWPSPALYRKEGWVTFMKVGIPSLVAVCAEWWAFEIQAFFAAAISPLALAVFGVAMNIVSMMFSVALGLSVSASAVVGNALGGQRPIFAAQYAKFIIICDIILGALTALAMGCFGGHIARLYTNVPELSNAVESTMPLVILAHVGDSLQFCLQGVFRGAGRPEQAALAVVLTLWLVGMPSSALYVFVFGWGVKGVIGGLITGFVFEIPLLYFLMLQWDWAKLAQESKRKSTAHQFVLVEETHIGSDDERGSNNSPVVHGEMVQIM
ncbi:Multi antimicrobial extrusion protein [Trypanosoma melophagium]|uniref:Multi antimicrobial extrusion protein n=1 Tax=Trypanosoma melophagium TaxID=715481 RepID=UPI00351A5118|nr:Multi antimicrobial extrusion protein [Trypanosoma melophagium]